MISTSGIDTRFTDPFASSIETYDRNVIYLSLLMMASFMKRDKDFFVYNLAFLMFILVGFYLELVYKTKGFRHTSLIYLMLYFLIKFHDLFWNISNSKSGYVFTLAAITCAIAVWINNNPQKVISLFRVDEY